MNVVSGLARHALCAGAAAVLLGGCGPSGFSPPGATMPRAVERSIRQTHGVPQWQMQGLAHRACPDAGPREAQCQLLILHQSKVKEPGWGARDIKAAYNLPSSSDGAGQIVAVIDAYDDPNVSSDLAVYRSHYGLPKAKFYKYNQEGQQSRYPRSCTDHDGWCVEIPLDVEMVSAACPNCTIYLIEASSFDDVNIKQAENEAVKLGAHVTSNSYTCASKGCLDGAFETPGVTYVAAAGDGGYGSQAPASFANVVSVGGTLLSRSGSIYSEVVWPDTGGGCATDVAKPSWQHDPSCAGRTGTDIAAVAWNVAEYTTYGNAGWVTVGGTSVATPIIASAFALAGNAGKQDGGRIFWTLTDERRQEYLHVISSGSNNCPRRSEGSYLCVAGTDEFGTYSGPTGWGTPNGIGAF